MDRWWMGGSIEGWRTYKVKLPPTAPPFFFPYSSPHPFPSCHKDPPFMAPKCSEGYPDSIGAYI